MPLTSPRSFFAELGAEKSVEVYRLDLGQFSPSQFDRLAVWTANHFQEPLGEVAAELRRTGFPIRAADVSVAIDMRAFL